MTVMITIRAFYGPEHAQSERSRMK